jgi:hypothetical protein
VVNRITLEVYDPSGSTEITNMHAPRLGTLRGKIIGELSNGQWQHDRTFAQIRNSLQKRYPDLKIIPYTKFPVGDIDVDGIAEMVKNKGCDCVIVGNAA